MWGKQPGCKEQPGSLAEGASLHVGLHLVLAAQVRAAILGAWLLQVIACCSRWSQLHGACQASNAHLLRTIACEAAAGHRAQGTGHRSLVRPR